MKTKVWVIAIIVMALISGSVYYKHSLVTEQQVAVIVNTQENKIMETLLKDKKTYCIGSYTLELPEGMAVDEETAPVVRFDDSNLVSKRMYSPAFEQRIRLREEELKQTTPIDPQDGSYLKATYPLDNGVKGVIFERMESIGMPDSARILETHFYKDNIAFLLEMEARNGEGNRYDKYRNEYPRLYANNIPKKLIFLNELISHINGQDEGKVSEKSGLCFLGGIISAQTVEHTNNLISFTLHFPANPDLYITLNYDNYRKSQESLASFKNYDESLIKKHGGIILRKEHVNINGMNSEQWLSKEKLNNGNDFFDFYLVLNGSVSSQKKPKLVINISFEQKKNALNKMSDPQMLALWDDITTTIKIH